MRRPLLILWCVLALLGSACGASDDAGSDDTEPSGTEAPPARGGAAAWGDLESPCGEGDATVAEGEGPATDRLLLGVANDRTGIRPGLNKELWDAANAYAEWCNAQGGIAGLPIELVDLDGSVTNVEAAMTTACTGVFAMVGGGFVLDDLEFSGKDGSDFHRCGLIDVPAFAVSIQKSLSNGQVQPLPNPGNRRGSSFVTAFKEAFPDESRKNVVVYSSDIPSMTTVKASYDAIVDEVGGIERVDPITYPLVVSDWGPYAEAVIDSGATSLYWIGEPENAANFERALAEKEWGGAFLSESNLYDSLFLDSGAAESEKVAVRIAFHPFEEADDWPAVRQYLDNLSEHVPDGKAALLGMQGTSAFLLFSVAAKRCADENDGVIDRTCVLTEAAAIDDWTGGGLHVPSDPGGDGPPECSTLMTIEDGAWRRLVPQLGDDHDDLDGFYCPEGSAVTVPDRDLTGEGVVDPDRQI